MTSQALFPTNNHSKAFIAYVWGIRAELEESQRRGFYQFLYLTICAHIESLLFSIIKARLHSIQATWYSIPPMNYTENNISSLQDRKVVVESGLKIIKSLEKDIEKASLDKLIEIHNKIFKRKLSELISRKLYEDLKALPSLRNSFAHGRDLFLEFKLDAFSTEKLDFDSNPLKPAFDRLVRANIAENISSFNFENYNDLIALFYSDNACLYFYNAIQEIEKELNNSIEFPPEKRRRFSVALPNLE